MREDQLQRLWQKEFPQNRSPLFAVTYVVRAILWKDVAFDLLCAIPPSKRRLNQPTSKSMFISRKKTTLFTCAAAALLSTSLAFAGEVTAAKEVAPIEKEEVKVVSGTLSLQANTHFISYGADVWAAGGDWDDLLFQPSLELSIALGNNVSWIVGTWWDVNDNAPSNIAKRIQEVDVWTGLSYTLDKWSFKLLYQAWMYADETEEIVDLTIGYKTFLNPSITIHGRLNQGAAGGDEGVFFVLSGSEGFSAGPVSFSFPISVAFATSDYHGGDGGFAYASLGANASIPLPFLPGSWTANAGVTGYYTEPDVIPGNVEDTFITGNFGVTLSF